MSERNHEVPSTAKRAMQMLADLNLPVPPIPLISQISQEEGEQFKDALGAVHANRGDRMNHQYLGNVLTAYSPYTSNAIRRLGFIPPSPQDLLPIVREGGKPFRAAIKAIGNGRCDKEVSNFLKLALAPLDLRTIHENNNNTGAGNEGQETPRNHADMDIPGRHEHPSMPPVQTDSVVPEAKIDIESAHLYGKQAAFCFTKSRTLTGNFHTMTIDAAKASGEKSYDWKNKCVFQLTCGEVPLVYGVLFGCIDEVKLVGHGKANNKSFSIKDQDAGYYLTMQMGRDVSFAIPAIAKDTYRIMAMMMEQMKLNSPGLTTNDIMLLVKRVCSKHVNPQMRAAS